MDIVTLAAAMAYTKKTADALGAVKGAPCTITAIEPIAGGHKITFEWKSTSGQIETDTLDIMDGAEGQQGQTGPEGPAGPAGVSPSITIEQITGGHRVTITDAQHPQGQSFDVMDGSGGSPDWDDIQNKPNNLATTEDVNAKVFVAEYNVTTAQQINAFLDRADPKACVVVKRGNDYYTVITTAKQEDNKVIIRTFATLSGNFYIFTYTITNGTWANSNYGVQKILESGTTIKTVNGQSLLGAGDISTNDDTGWKDLNTIIKYRKKNGVCTLAIRGEIPSDIGAAQFINIGVLPNQFRPAILLFFEVHIKDFSSVLRIQASGAIDLYGASSGATAGDIVSGSANYPV